MISEQAETIRALVDDLLDAWCDAATDLLYEGTSPFGPELNALAEQRANYEARWAAWVERAGMTVNVNNLREAE